MKKKHQPTATQESSELELWELSTISRDGGMLPTNTKIPRGRKVQYVETFPRALTWFWMLSLTRSMGAAAVFETAAETPPTAWIVSTANP